MNPAAASSGQSQIGLEPPGDFATRVRLVQRTLLAQLSRRHALIELVRSVNSTSDPRLVADALLEIAQGWLPAPCWAVVAEDGSHHLEVLAERGPAGDFTAAFQAVGRWVIERGDGLSTANLKTDPRVPGESVAAVLALPLKCRARTLGALIALDPAPSSQAPRLAPAALELVDLLLEQSSLALDNALRLQRAEALSVTDDLTSLYNTRYLNLVLRRETKRASRSGRPVSLLFIDLDGFKSINDAHGHLSGSRALVEAAVVIRGSARETDVVARFGGDEFSVVLPDTGSEGALAVAERVRERIAAHGFLAGDGRNIHLTASVGVATLPDVAASAEDLIKAADVAMYQVKDAGKNGVRIASEEDAGR